MVKNIKKFAMVILFCFILLVSGCIEKRVVITDKNVLQVGQIDVDSEIGRTEDKIDGSNGIESTKPEYKIEFEYIDNLDELEIEDLNSDDIKKVILQLPNKWHARKATYKIADDFEFKEEKNKGIRKLSDYDIHDDDNKLIGEFSYIGYYSDEPFGPVMLNHCVIKETIYQGETKLGKGAIYLLECDLPNDKVTDRYSTYDRVYALIPIQNESLAYTISLFVPLGKNNDKYIEIMKEMLIDS